MKWIWNFIARVGKNSKGLKIQLKIAVGNHRISNMAFIGII